DGSHVANAGSTVQLETGKTTSIDVTLPNDTIGASKIELRILGNNGGGADQLIAIDNITVFGADSFRVDPASVTVSEGNQVSVNVVRDPGLGAATVQYAAQNITTTNGDYTLPAGTLSFAAGETSKSITLTAVNDGLSEGP